MPNKILFSPKEGTSGFSCNGVEIVNPEVLPVEKINGNYFNTTGRPLIMKSGDLLDIPIGFEFKEEVLEHCETSCENSHCKSNGCMNPLNGDRIVLRLVKTETKEQPSYYDQFDLPAAAVFQIQMIALADDEMVKRPGAAEAYRSIARHTLDLFKSKVAQPEPEESQYWLWDEVDNIFQANKSDEAMRICERKFTIQRKKQ